MNQSNSSLLADMREVVRKESVYRNALQRVVSCQQLFDDTYAVDDDIGFVLFDCCFDSGNIACVDMGNYAAGRRPGEATEVRLISPDGAFRCDSL